MRRWRSGTGHCAGAARLNSGVHPGTTLRCGVSTGCTRASAATGCSRSEPSTSSRDVPVWRRPALEPTNPTPTKSQQAVWLATHGTRWLLARSRDLLPQLAGLVVTEWWGDLRVSLPWWRATHWSGWLRSARSARGLPLRATTAATQRSQRAERAIKHSAMREQPQNPANLRM